MSEPCAKYGHLAWSVGDKTYVWGGHDIGGGSLDLSSIDEYGSYSESWTKKKFTGKPPPGSYFGMSASQGDRLFAYRGYDHTSRVHGSLKELNVAGLEWGELFTGEKAKISSSKVRAGMAYFGENKLAVFGSYDHTGSYTNNFEVFDLDTRKWSSPTLYGTKPPPRAYFTFTSIDRNRAILFGGEQSNGAAFDCTYLFDFSKMECTKLEPAKGQPSPPARSRHAACCLNYGSDYPQVLISGGRYGSSKYLNDLWVLDVNSLKWRKLPTEGDVWQRRSHTLTAHSLGPGVTEVLMFGGFARGFGIASTAVLLFEGPKDSSSSEQWTMTDVATMRQLATPERLAKKEDLRSQLHGALTDSLTDGNSTRKRRLSMVLPSKGSTESVEQASTHKPVDIPFKDLQLKETIGKGTFGVVYKGYWRSSGRGRQLVAIKQLNKMDEEEVKLLGTLCHPNIITLYGTAENPPYLYLVTDYAENGSLYRFISERPSSPDLKRSLPWAKQVAEGMLYLHHHGIVHRDLKSNNVVLTSQWVAKICDLGTARESDHATMMSSVGTLAWMSPEIAMAQPAFKPCDVYSYGILLWELATHEQPFKGMPQLSIPHEVSKGARPPIPESTDVAVKELIEECWQSKPEDRPVFESVLHSLEEYEMGKMEYEELQWEKSVGAGSYGEVSKGFWNTKKAGRLPVAIKHILYQEGYEKEGELLSLLWHPNIIHLYGYLVKEVQLYIVTEFAENGSLREYIKANKGKPERERALKWGREIAEGMCYLHKTKLSKTIYEKFVHRDLKSDNVLLMSDWTAKICDLGTAKKLQATVRQTVVGTYAWMAPEIIKEEPASEKCDVYSYAIVLWELVTYQVPFEGLSRFKIMMKVSEKERPPIPSGCDQFFSDLIQQCWAGNYQERPSFDDIMGFWSNYIHE